MAKSLVRFNSQLCTPLAGIANKDVVTAALIRRLQNEALNQAPLTEVFDQGGLDLVAGDVTSESNGRDVD